MAPFTHFEMEQALRTAGLAVRPYPTAKTQSKVFDLREEDRRLIEAGSAWERELERLYAMHVQNRHLVRQSDFAVRFDNACAEEGMARALAS